MNEALDFNRLFLLDLDGTIYTGGRLHKGAADFLRAVKENGGTYVFLSNNSSRSVEEYVNKLAGFGIETDTDSFFISTQAAAIYIKNNLREAEIYALASASCMRELQEYGVNITLEADDAEAVLVAYDTELTYEKLYEASRLITKGLPYIATHPDMLCPVEFGFVPDCGSICEMLYHATGRKPITLGKPMADMALYVCDKFGYGKSEAVMVGDRIYTDIACAKNAGITSVLMLSGETSEEMFLQSELKPDYAFKDINEMYLYIKALSEK